MITTQPGEWYNTSRNNGMERMFTDDPTSWMYFREAMPVHLNISEEIAVVRQGFITYTITLSDHFEDWAHPTEAELILWEVSFDFPYVTKEVLDEYLNRL